MLLINSCSLATELSLLKLYFSDYKSANLVIKYLQKFHLSSTFDKLEVRNVSETGQWANAPFTGKQETWIILGLLVLEFW